MARRKTIQPTVPAEVTELGATLMSIFGTGVWDDSAFDTATRVLKAWREFKPQPELSFNFTTFKATTNQLVICKDIDFASLCGHHLFPFHGRAHIGYIPNHRMVGLSKIPRVVDHFAHRPQTQETLTESIASFLKEKLDAQGVAVILESQHTCMCCRGVRKHGASMTTSVMKGVFLMNATARQEFMTLLGLQGAR